MPNFTKAVAAKHARSDFLMLVGVAAVLLFFIGSGYVSYSNTRILSQNAELVTQTHEVITSLSDLLSAIKDAETGQRGYIITGEDKYLDPYRTALADVSYRLSRVETLTKDNPLYENRIPPLKKNIDEKMAELAKSIEVRKTSGLEKAKEFVETDSGRILMEAVRREISDMRDVELSVRKQRIEERAEAYRTALFSGIVTGILGVAMTLFIAVLLRRSTLLKRLQQWVQEGESGLSTSLLGDQKIDHLSESALKFLANYFGANAGALYTREEQFYRRAATFGIPAGSAPEHIGFDDSLLAQAARDKKAMLVQNVPDGYLRIGSSLGQTQPKCLIISPSIDEGICNAVIELGFTRDVSEQTLRLLEKMSENIGIAVRSANYRSSLQSLLEETQRQAEELQAQSEELRVSNEELEEQSRVLRETQYNLEQQRAELEQTNAQLEEQTNILETQKDDITRAKAAVQLKAQELEQASQYKSDFLANMSHELRTPLNSSLILAKLLADNPNGNLTAEQVKFAKTIQTAGNDLLTLINDILDLSKIEAGHMDIQPEPIAVDRILKDMARMFDPLAKQKGLDFVTKMQPGCPETVETDKTRLEQVLKNLVSNALKFTEKGSVEVTVSKNVSGALEFAVKDTGIGIAPEQQKAIFEAFRQADGSISRKYGGTGLGLSISRELTRLLGGKIRLVSVPGEGSTFIITLPVDFTGAKENEEDVKSVFLPTELPKENKTEEKPVYKPRPKSVPDDRENLSGNKRTLLIIEDDSSFANILVDLAHELGFQALACHTAEDALVMARQYMPQAMILDVGLPDHSGLSVLDRIKRDPKTRHIPVHVVSALDYTQTALSLGALGYMMKPVKRDELVGALRQVEDKLSQKMRRVLIVEDDEVQLDSLQRLLSSHEVETVGAGTAAECLEQLKSTTFDCMVLDLTLPDATGFSLLETLSREDAYSFPPVIVYTGRELGAEEEQRLRRYSKSIIIKGAKSPERLLDEVTLFLHKVVSDLPPEQQKMLEKAKNRDAVLEGRRILVVEDDVANVYALTSILEPRGAKVEVARNGHEALAALEKFSNGKHNDIDLVLMDVMMPEMDGLTATRMIRKKSDWNRMPIIMLTAKAMKDDQEKCIEAGANDYMAKPLDVEKLLSLVRVWMPR